jgi:MmyB-like transcription regulator ligand binding domain
MPMREPLCWPASASSTTRGSNAGPRGGSPRACWKGSPALYSSTRPSAPPDRSCARREQVAAGAPSSYSATRTPERAADPRLDDGDASLRAQRALDVLYANELGRALFSELFSDPSRPANSARYVFLDRRATDFFIDCENIANDVVALLRAEAGRDPDDVSSGSVVQAR